MSEISDELVKRMAEEVEGERPDSWRNLAIRFARALLAARAERDEAIERVGKIETCGRNAVLPSERMGCGASMLPWEVYRCWDCKTPYHIDCAKRGPCACNNPETRAVSARIVQEAGKAHTRAESAEAEAKSWRRVAERLEGEKVALRERLAAVEGALRPFVEAWRNAPPRERTSYMQKVLDLFSPAPPSAPPFRPADLLDAQQDRVHVERGGARGARAVRVMPTDQVKPISEESALLKHHPWNGLGVHDASTCGGPETCIPCAVADEGPAPPEDQTDAAFQRAAKIAHTIYVEVCIGGEWDVTVETTDDNLDRHQENAVSGFLADAVRAACDKLEQRMLDLSEGTVPAPPDSAPETYWLAETTDQTHRYLQPPKVGRPVGLTDDPHEARRFATQRECLEAIHNAYVRGFLPLLRPTEHADIAKPAAAPEACPDCGGTGEVSASVSFCPECESRDFVREYGMVSCKHCSWWMDADEPCPRCRKEARDAEA